MNNEQQNLQKIAEVCYRQLQLPQFTYIKKYLNDRYITDDLIDYFNIGYGKFYGKLWITIPIKDINDNVVLIKLRKDPTDDTNKIKYIAYPHGVEGTIFGAKELLTNETIVYCEGELDRIILSSQGIPSITCTTGSQGFKKDWIFIFKNTKKVFLAFDRDEAGEKGAEKLGNMILEQYPHIQVLKCNLPEEVGEHGDITDLIKIGKGKIDIDKLFYENSYPIQLKIKIEQKQKKRSKQDYINKKITKQDIERASKADCKQFVKIDRVSGNVSFAKCPFHKENTASFACYEGGKGYYCFGCGASGDAIDLVMKLYNLDFVEAVKYILSII